MISLPCSAAGVLELLPTVRGSAGILMWTGGQYWPPSILSQASNQQRRLLAKQSGICRR